MILTVREIRDLAEFAGLSIVDDSRAPDDDIDLGTELTVEPCPPQGILDEDTGKREHYRMIAFYTDYPDEGATGLGVEVTP